jgi:hypothetical protein
MTVTPINRRVEGILEESRKVEFLHSVRWFVTAIFFGIGWVIGSIFRVTWRIITFMYVAAVVGFKDATKKGG